jgi:hypothetical protein
MASPRHARHARPTRAAGPGRPGHSVRPVRPARRGRSRLLVVLAAPLAVLLSLTAGAATRTPAPVHATRGHAVVHSQLRAATGPVLRYSHTWSPPYNEHSNYQPCCPSTAVFTTLPFSMNVYGNQEAVLSVRMKTNWVDSKARHATPNIIQQGRYIQPTETKISIHSGPAPKDHHAECRIAGAGGGVINAQGPKSIDIADGNWHTIVCVKYPDSTSGSSVQVFVDGVAGPVYHSSRLIGNMINTGTVDLGGQGPVANKDSIDGEYISVSYSVG